MTRAGLAEERVRRLGILPVVEIENLNQADDLFAALAKGGIDAAEITLRTSNAAAALEQLITRNPDALLGAGTVRTLDDARRVVDIGASFVVSPGPMRRSFATASNTMCSCCLASAPPRRCSEPFTRELRF